MSKRTSEIKNVNMVCSGKCNRYVAWDEVKLVDNPSKGLDIVHNSSECDYASVCAMAPTALGRENVRFYLTSKSFAAHDLPLKMKEGETMVDGSKEEEKMAAAAAAPLKKPNKKEYLPGQIEKKPEKNAVGGGKK